MAAFDEQEYTKSFDWKIWKRLLPLLKPYRSAFAGMLLFNGICALIDVILPLFQRYAIGNFIEAGTFRAFSLRRLLFGRHLFSGSIRCGVQPKLHAH